MVEVTVESKMNEEGKFVNIRRDLVSFLNERKTDSSKFSVNIFNEDSPDYSGSKPAYFDLAVEAVEFAASLQKILRGSMKPEYAEFRGDISIALEITNFKEIEDEDVCNFEPEGDVWFLITSEEESVDLQKNFYGDVLIGGLIR